MNRYATFVIIAISIGTHLFAADGPIAVDWSKSGNVSAVERTRSWNQAVTAIQSAGYIMPSNATVKAEFWPERDGLPFAYLEFRISTGKSDMLDVKCSYPLRKWPKMYHDWDAEKVAEKHDKEVFRKRYDEAFKKNPNVPYPDLLDTVTQHPRAEAEKRARALAKAVGNVDVGKWMCTSWQFNAGQWMFTFQPFFKEHRLRIGHVEMSLSDSDNLKLCKYLNTLSAPLPEEYDRVPDVIPQAKARELADKYLNQYVYRGKPPYLAFRTNILEVVRPNYWFTDKYDDSWQWLKSPPRWAWTQLYEPMISTNNVGFSRRTPLCIVVDAMTGEFLGGED